MSRNVTRVANLVEQLPAIGYAGCVREGGKLFSRLSRLLKSIRVSARPVRVS